MTYLSGKAQKRTTYKKYALIGVVFFLFVASWPLSKKFLASTLEPAVLGYGSAKQSFVVFPEFFSTYIISHRTLAAKQQELESKVEDLENRLAEKDAIIRDALFEDSVSSSTDISLRTRHLVMYPLMQDVTRLYSTVLLSKGFKDGVTVGATVYMKGYQAVCTVKEVYDSTSLCTLFTASDIVTEGVTSSSSIVLSLTGRGGHFLANVPRDTPVSLGEKVYLRSNQKMLIGVVKQILNNNQDTSWHIFVEAPYNPVTSSIFYVQQQ